MGDQARGSAGRRLILVKHGQPVISPDQPRSQWALSDEGRASAARLADKLASFEPRALIASPEPKAFETARAMAPALGLIAQPDADLAEHRADHNPFVSPAEIEALIEQALRAPERLVMGEETGASAAKRFAQAIDRAASPGAKVIVAHGRIISFWLAARFGLDPVLFWRRLGFTSAAVVDARGAVEFIDP